MQNRTPANHYRLCRFRLRSSDERTSRQETSGEMMRLAFAVGLITCTAAPFYSGARAEPLPTVEPQKAGFSAERLNRIEEFFSREMAQKPVPGAVVGIAR